MAQREYTLIDYFRAFHSLKEQLKLSAGSQAMYFSILGEFNAARFPSSLSISIRELKALAGLKSVSAAHECLNVLKNKKLIDFHNQNGIHSYSLLTEHLPNTYRTEAEQNTEQEPNRSRTEKTNSNIRARVEVETEDIKTKEKERAGACEKILEWDSDIEERLTKLWRENNGCRVTAELLSYFQTLVEKHGAQWTQDAIKFASAKYGGSYWDMTLDFLQKRVAEMEGAKANGSRQRNPKVTPIASKPPENTGDEPWLNRDPNKPRKVKPLFPVS